MIRLADASDSTALTALIERYWEIEGIKGFDAAHITTLLDELCRSPDRGAIWIAQIDGRPVGYLLAAYLFSLEHGGLMAEIDEFFVVPEKRSLKIGSALLEAATTAMKQREITHVQLQLGATNSRGQRFYEHHGFRANSGYSLLHKSLRR